jgi:ferredoxin
VSCGVEAISLAAIPPRVDGVACLGCGACAANCPTGAIAMPGFAPPARRVSNLRIECARVPERLRTEDAWTVPCFAGVTLPLIASEAPLATRLSIEVIDRGLCPGCPVAHHHNQAAMLAEKLLAALDRAAPGACPVRCVKTPLDPMRADPPGTGASRSRRAIFRALLNGAPQTHDSGILAERAALSVLGPQAMVHPLIEIGADCADHGVCSAACPTGALAREDGEDGILTLRFDPARCVECGRCAEVCPGHALSLRPHAIATGERMVLRQVTMPVCTRCERHFVPEHDGDTECPACRKDAGLFKDLRRSLAGLSAASTRSARPAGPPASSFGGTT